VTRLKELDRMKGEMIRMVSHDLKNPLMGALLHIDLMRDMHIPQIDESLNIVDRQLERMDRIIRGVLDLERLRSGRLHLSAHDLIPIVDKVVGDLDRLSREAGISVSVAYERDEAIIQCDVDQVERAISNLIENALKFTPSGGTVQVSVKQSDPAHVSVEVADSGIGIPDDIQAQVFERFFRGRQRGFEHVTGSGLGLAIVKTIMDSHHGQVSLRSTVGEGTTFTLRFMKPAMERLVAT
jgi:signal transduction histidine kinase